MTGAALLGGSLVLGSRRVDAAALGKGTPAPRGVTSWRAADADEDDVTLAVAAAREALARTGRAPAEVGQLFLVGGFSPEGAAVITESLGRPDVPVSTFAGTPDAAADALLVAFAAQGPAATLLVAASDGRAGPSWLGHGAGAAAVLVGVGKGVSLRAESHRRVDRAEAEHGRALVDTTLAALKGGGRELLVMAEHVPGDARALLGTHAGRELHQLPSAEMGDLGCVGPLAALLDAAASLDAGRSVLWVVPEPTACVAGLFQLDATVPCVRVRDALGVPATLADGESAPRLAAAWRGAEGRVAQGAFVSPQTYLARAAARYRWEGQRCAACSEVVFPPRESCPRCTVGVLQPYPLSGKGTVFARTQIGRGGAPTEFAPLQEAAGPYGVAIVALAEGPRVAAMLTGPGADALRIGGSVQFELRLLYVQDGMRRYGFKAVAVRSG